MQKALWYFDVISPFAYLALPDIETLSQSVQVIYRPVLLAGLLKHFGQLGPAEIPPKRIHTYRLCVWEAQQRGLTFRFPPVHPFNSLRPLRLLCALHAQPGAVRFVMDRIWRDGQDLSADGPWRQLCADMQIESADTLASSAMAKETLRANSDAAVTAGVFGVPTLVIDGHLFWGSDAVPLARAYLANPQLFDSGEMARVATLPAVIRDRSQSL